MAGSALTDINGRGILSARPSAGRAGRNYYGTDTLVWYRDNGSSWDTQSGSGISDPTTTRGDMLFRNNSGAIARLALGAANTLLHGSATDPSYGAVVPADMDVSADVTTGNATSGHHGFLPKLSGSSSDVLKGDGTFGAGASGSQYPLDSYALDGTYGDHFTGGSLSGSWTRRNYTSGAESYAQGKSATYLRINNAIRASGDGYFRTAPAGDWTFAMKFIQRFTPVTWGLGVVDTNGTGVGMVANYPAHTPWASLMQGVTTYTTWSGSYYEPIFNGSSTSPNLAMFSVDPMDRPIWVYLRKSSTNYYCAYSLDGEIWSPEGGPLAWAGTVDRVAMINATGGTAGGTNGVLDIDWFNKIA